MLLVFLLHWVLACRNDRREWPESQFAFSKGVWILTRLPFFRHHISECYLATESVKLDRQISLNGQASKCYSVEPVLRCQPGCSPVRTTTVNVGFHCVPAGEWNKKTWRGLRSNASSLSQFLNGTISTAAETGMNRAESLSRIFQKSVDVTEKAVAHLACRCNPQCA